MYDKIFRKKEMANWNRLHDSLWDKSFDCQKEEVLRLEGEIRDIVGEDPDSLSSDVLARNKEELELLLSQRRTLLNWMFLETPEEVARMDVLNSQLFKLTNQLREKMADVCGALAACPRDEFIDDYEVCGTLRFSYNEDESILSYEGDEIYGCDFPLMIALNNRLTGKEPPHFLEIYCRYNDSREEILNAENLDDGNSWAHETAGFFEGICICHTTAVFCRDLGYPLVDVLHLNDFWNEVHVRYQQFATLDPNYKWTRD